MSSLDFHGMESLQVTFDRTSGGDSHSTTAQAPTAWLFAVDPDPGTGNLVFSGEYTSSSAGVAFTVINFAAFNPFTTLGTTRLRDSAYAWPCTWKTVIQYSDLSYSTMAAVSDSQIGDHFHEEALSRGRPSFTRTRCSPAAASRAEPRLSQPINCRDRGASYPPVTLPYAV